MKTAFYFTLKVIFVLNKFNLCPDLFGDIEKRLHQKVSKFQNL